IVCPGKVLGLGSDEVIAQTAAAKIVLLEVSRGLREPQLINQVVVAIGPEEQVRNCTHSVIGVARRISSARSRIIGKIKSPERRASRPACRVYAIWRDNVQSRIDVVAGRDISAVSDPAEVIERRQFADQSKQRPADAWRLKTRSRTRQGSGRKRRRA